MTLAADDFDSIRSRISELRAAPRHKPEDCPGHVFNLQGADATGRCIHCDLHHYHLPALQAEATALEQLHTS